MLACRFFLSVEKNEIQINLFDQSTQDKIFEITNAIENMLT